MFRWDNPAAGASLMHRAREAIRILLATVSWSPLFFDRLAANQNGNELMKSLIALAVLASTLVPASGAAIDVSFPLTAKRIVFLGDSNTHAGEYVNLIETQLRLQSVDPLPEIINIGLSSETCSGMSEPPHPFPRPDVHERLDRALQMLKPDVVVACYGMNDGIYHPFSEERFAIFQDGVNRLIAKVHAAGAKLVLITPPPFDAEAVRPSGKLLPEGKDGYAYFAVYENYDDVIKKYGQWIMEQKSRVGMVIDVHSPVAAFVAQKRKADPKFTAAPDGVHVNSDGHQILAEAILKAWGVESWMPVDPELRKLMNARGKLLHDSWLSHVGHKRPGIADGLPVEEARQKAAEIEKQIQPLIDQARQPVSSSRRSADGTIHQLHFASVAKSGELRLSADYYLWLPDGVENLRGVIVHQHGCGTGASLGGQTAADDLHWQALARKWNCALMGSMYEPREGVNCRLWCDARNGSEHRFLQALDHFAATTKHVELTSAPWCLWGHSGGAFWASLMQVQHPERIVAIWLRSGTAFPYWSRGEIEVPTIPAAAYQIPVMGNPGLKEKDDARFNIAWNGTKAMQAEYQKQGAPFFEFAPDPRTGHECGDSRYLAIPYFDFWLQHRLPAADAASSTLKPATAALDSWKVRMAPLQEEYISTGAVADTTPPPAPHSINATRSPEGNVVVTWSAVADFESGIRGFVIERDGTEIGHVPEKPIGRFGRPLFQAMSYHDTPESPLPSMQFTDTTAPEGTLPVYRVRAINSAELMSESSKN